MLRKFTRYIIALLGLTGFGVIATELFKKWHFVSKTTSPIWIIVPILILFICNEFIKSSYVKNNPKFSHGSTSRVVTIINTILIILCILALISIPFIWYGTIEELAGREGGGYRP